MQPMARPPFGSITEPVDPKRFDGRHIVDFPFKGNGRGYLPNRREAREWNAAQIWRQAFGDTAKTQLTDTRYSHRNAVVSPDGRWIAFVADPELRPDSVVQAERDSLAKLPYDADRDEKPRNDADVFVIPATGGEPRRVTRMNGSEGRLVWSPDSKRIAFVSSLTRTSSNRIWIVDAQGGARARQRARRLAVRAAERRLDEEREARHERVGRWAHGALPRGSEGRRAHGGRRRAGGASTASPTTTPTGRWRSWRRPWTSRPSCSSPTSTGRTSAGSPASTTPLNAEIAWPKADRFTYTSVGGLEIEAWLQYPYGYEAGKKYPLVLYIHGGPHSAYGEGWFDEFHNITGAGMFVLYTNPRGSSGYGADFTYSTRGRWGMEDYEDLMKAVDVAIQRPDVDADNIGVTGGSYGGFMTAWITTKTNRFKAAQTDRMISDWFSWYGSSDAQGLTEFEFYGKPWDNPDLYRELSPATHVANVRTPTLMVQSEEDFRTPMTGAEEWFIALRKQGVPVEFVRYPRSTHDLSRTGEPWLLVDRLGRLRQWFTHWLVDGGVTTDKP